MRQVNKDQLLRLLLQHKDLGISEQIDFDKFYLYSIITHSTAIEGSTVTEVADKPEITTEAIVRQFNDAFQSVTARREIKKKILSILCIKNQIKDNKVFDKAYQYIEQYY